MAFATPAYPPFFGALPYAGVKLINVGLHADGSIDLDGLDAALAAGIRALVLASPHNPTGRVLPRGELEAIAERCAEHEVWVLADEIHAPLTLPGATHVPWLEASDAARRWGVTVTSASKAFNLAALKAALIVTADPAARDLVARMPPLHEHAGLLGAIAAEAAFDDGDPWFDAVIAQLDANRGQLGENSRATCPASSGDHPRLRISPGSTATASASAMSPPRSSSPEGESRSAAASTTAHPAPATSASTSPPAPNTCPKPWHAWRVPPPTGNRARRPACPGWPRSTIRRLR